MKKKLNEIAKCQIKYSAKGEINLDKCERCQDRFVCRTNRFDVKNIKVPGWVFYVKADEDGKKFVKMIEKTINRELFTHRVRGRAKNRSKKGGNQSHQPLKMADYFAIYVKLTPLAEKMVENQRS